MAERTYNLSRADITRGYITEVDIGTLNGVTADFTEWRHIFRLRTQKAAHWEIRTVMCKVLKAFQELFPTAFDDFIKVGEDDNDVPYYKIKGFVDDIPKMLRDGLADIISNKEMNGSLVNAPAIVDHLIKYYNQNY